MSPANFVLDSAYLALATLCGSISTIVSKRQVRLDQHGRDIYDDIRLKPAGSTRSAKFDEEKAEVGERGKIQQDNYLDTV